MRRRRSGAWSAAGTEDMPNVLQGMIPDLEEFLEMLSYWTGAGIAIRLFESETTLKHVPSGGPDLCSSCTLRDDVTSCGALNCSSTAKLRRSTLSERCPNGIGIIRTSDTVAGLALSEILVWGIEGPKESQYESEKIFTTQKTVTLTLRVIKHLMETKLMLLTAVHEIALALDASRSSAARLRHIAQTPSNEWDEKRTRDVVNLANHVGAEAELGTYILNNLIQSADNSERPKEGRIHGPPINLTEVIQDVVSLFQGRARDEGIDIVNNIGDDACVMIEGEILHIRRALYNVLNNALKYSFKSSPGRDIKRYIRVYLRNPFNPHEAARSAAVYVENYGVSLAEGEKQMILRKGYRGKFARAERPMGSGIGLSEVDRIMRWHGGKVLVRAQEHKGTSGGVPSKFTVALVFPTGGERA